MIKKCENYIGIPCTLKFFLHQSGVLKGIHFAEMFPGGGGGGGLGLILQAPSLTFRFCRGSHI